MCQALGWGPQIQPRSSAAPEGPGLFPTVWHVIHVAGLRVSTQMTQPGVAAGSTRLPTQAAQPKELGKTHTFCNGNAAVV